MEPFRVLGQRIDQAWESADFDENSFPHIAADALAAELLPQRISGDDVLQWVLQCRELPAQQDLRASFGQPPITVYRGRRFHIQVLYWLDGSTTIHRHGFCGAFQVLEGGSLHARWKFVEQQHIHAHFLVGQTLLQGAEILHRAEIVPITPDLTHGLFHLDAPSATIVVRTNGESVSGPQYEYHPPTIAVDPFFVDPLLERQLQVVHLYRASGHAQFETHLLDLLRRVDAHSVFRLLYQELRVGATIAQLEMWANVARDHHGDIVDAIVAALLEGVRRRSLHSLRRQIRDPRGRFFLALLQNLPHRHAVLDIIRAKHPGQLPRTVLGELVQVYALALGVDTSDDLERILVNSLLDDKPVDDVFRQLALVYDEASIAAQRAEVLEQMQRLRNSLLGPLFIPGAT